MIRKSGQCGLVGLHLCSCVIAVPKSLRNVLIFTEPSHVLRQGSSAVQPESHVLYTQTEILWSIWGNPFSVWGITC